MAEEPVGLAATEGIVEVEDRAGMEVIMAATEGIMAGMEDIGGIMAGMADIMAEAISTEDPASTSVDTLGTPTTIPTGTILTPIITLPLITILIKSMLLPSPPLILKRSKSPIGAIARLPKGIPLTLKSVRQEDEGGLDSSPVGKRKELT